MVAPRSARKAGPRVAVTVPSRVVVARVVAWVVAWVVLATAVAVPLFLESRRQVVLAGHESVVRPTLSGRVVLRTGPVLPDVRRDSGGPLGLEVTMGKSEARTVEELVTRYALIASQPDAQVDKARDAVVEMAWAASLRGAAVGGTALTAWALVGARRRRELWDRARSRWPVTVVGITGVAVAAALVWQPWDSRDRGLADPTDDWQSLGDFLGPAIPLPPEARLLEISVGLTTDQTRRLIESAVESYRDSKLFYARAAEAAAALTLRVPEEGETVAILISDRHDNVGMDPVARAVAEAAGATAVLDAGDDTSTGRSWEAFSLDSLDAAFADLDRFSVAGNHDNGDFVSDYLADLGWTALDGEVVDGPGGGPVLGADDPRSSGLGSWRDETGLSFDEQAARITEAACGSSERISTLLVHDVDSGLPALEAGCADLVLGGHLHVRVGPVRVEGPDGQVGYHYTTGTTGGAAYAVAVGTKIRRTAMVTLVTYREGRPVGLQPVTLETNGVFEVGDYVSLTYS